MVRDSGDRDSLKAFDGQDGDAAIDGDTVVDTYSAHTVKNG